MLYRRKYKITFRLSIVYMIITITLLSVNVTKNLLFHNFGSIRIYVEKWGLIEELAKDS